MEEKIKSKKRIIIEIVCSFLLMILAIAIIILSVILKVSNKSMMISVIIAVSLLIVATIIFIHDFKDALYYELKKSEEKVLKQELTLVENVDQNEMIQYLNSHKFVEIETNLYRRKKFSFLKDFVCYYIKFVDLNFKDLTKEIEQELESLDKIHEKCRNVCILLIINKSDVREEDFNTFKRLSQNLSLSSNVYLDTYFGKSCLPILIEGNQLYYLENKKGEGITIYSMGCRFLKKMLKK